MFGGPAFIGECKWTIPNKVFARKTTKDSLPLEFAEKTKHQNEAQQLEEKQEI